MDQVTALLVSIAVEAALAAGLLSLSSWGKPLRGVAVAALATLVTHPVVWWMFPEFEFRSNYWTAFTLVEALVVLAEAAAYRLIVSNWLRALGLSFAANAASAGIGMLYYFSRL